MGWKNQPLTDSFPIMTISYETGNGSHWEEIHSTTLNAPTPPVNDPYVLKDYGINAYQVPVFLQNGEDLVAIWAYSPSAPDKWKYAGRVYQVIQSGLSQLGNYDSVISVKRFWLKQTTILHYRTDYQSTYGLRLEIPFWIRDLQIQVHRYIGPVHDSHLSKMLEIEADIATLQADFDAYTGM